MRAAPHGQKEVPEEICAWQAHRRSPHPRSRARRAQVPDTEFVSVLVDTTRCIGCRDCEVACAVQNDLPVPEGKDKSVFAEIRDTTPDRVDGGQQVPDRCGRGLRQEAVHALQPGRPARPPA